MSQYKIEAYPPVTLSSWRELTMKQIDKRGLLNLLLQNTEFSDSEGRQLLTWASLKFKKAQARAANYLIGQRLANDLRGSWLALAALDGSLTGALALIDELMLLSRFSERGKTPRLYRLIRSWADMLTGHLQSPAETLRDEIDLIGKVTGGEPPKPAASPVPAVTGPSLIVCQHGIRDDKKLTEAWQALTKPLPLATGPSPDVLEAVLLGEFPWLAEAVEAIVGDLRLRRSAGQSWIKWRPLLLVGPPGTGKTRLTHRIAELVGTGFGEVNAAGSSDNRALQGTARGWNTASPALPLHVICQSGVANPVMLVDEIDKPRPDGRNGDIRATLLTMLEPLSAKAWQDECLMTPVDISQVNWLLTANDVACLRGPLLTRLRVIEAPAPRAEHFDSVMAGIRREMAIDLGVLVNDLPELPHQAEKQLRRGFERGISLRKVRNALEGAIKAGGGIGVGRPLN